MRCTKISAEFDYGVIAPWVRNLPQNVALGYDVRKKIAQTVKCFFLSVLILSQ